MEYAGFWRRFAALLIDALILMIPSIVLQFVVPFAGGLLLALAYYPIFTSSELMGTPGKVFMGLAVTNEQGGRLTAKESFLRYLLSIVSSVFLCLGYLFNLFTPKRQTFHDLMVGSVVIRRPELTNVDWAGAWMREFKRIFNISLETAGASRLPPRSTLETLESLHKLFQQGALSEAEYNAKKEELLKKI